MSPFLQPLAMIAISIDLLIPDIYLIRIIQFFVFWGWQSGSSGRVSEALSSNPSTIKKKERKRAMR
jgi:hypothetical protein